MTHFKKKQYVLKRCTKCEYFLTDNQVYYHYGICPYCHYNNHATVCKYQHVMVEYTYKTFWNWIFGKRERTLVKPL